MARRFRRQPGRCWFCDQEGKETILAPDWMDVQVQMTDVGDPLACREHLYEQQREIRSRKAQVREAYRKQQ